MDVQLDERDLMRCPMHSVDSAVYMLDGISDSMLAERGIGTDRRRQRCVTTIM